MNELTSNVEEKIKYELNKIRAVLKGSSMEEEALGNDGVTNPLNQRIAKLIDTKLDKSELDKQLSKKVSKTETEMMARQITILHKQLKQMVVLITQKFRASLETGKGETD